MMTPMRMRPPPVTESMAGLWPVMRLCTRKATMSSVQPRLDTRLGQASWRDLVWVVKARSPDTESPAYMATVAGVREAQEEGDTSREAGEARQ